MTSLQLALLGGFQAHAAGQQIDIPGRKERGLLAFLAIPAGEARSREKLAGLLWSDRGDAQARESLKQAIFKLRRSLDGAQPSPLLADREFVGLEKTAVTVDVAEFEQLIGEGTIESLSRATALYRGDLLDGLDLRDAAFDEWLLMERQRLRDLARETLAKLVDWHMSAGAHDQAAAAARRLLAIDSLREVTHRALMQIYAAQGQTALALKQYRLCRDALEVELGVRPEAETERLYRSIQEKRSAGRQVSEHQASAKISDEEGPLLYAPPPVREPAASVAKPSIAVLPFVNLSGDPAQDYFAEGIAEEIILDLGRFRSLLVISRPSSFSYKGRSVSAQTVGRELNVQYAVEGSVRRAGGRLRVIAQLIDAETGSHLWGERYDRDAEDIFSVQDEVTQSIVANVAGRLDDVGSERALRKRSEQLSIYDILLQGRYFLNRGSETDVIHARELYEHALGMEPTNARAHVGLAWTYVYEADSYWTENATAAARRAFGIASKAIELDSHDSEAHLILAGVYLKVQSNFDLASSQVESAIRLNPNDCYNYCFKSWLSTCSGDPDGGIACAQEALRRNPLLPDGCLHGIGFAEYLAGRYEQALSTLGQMSSTRHLDICAFMAACYVELGRVDDARLQVEEFRHRAASELTVSPIGSATAWRAYWVKHAPLKDVAQLDRFLDSLRKLGLPG